MFLVYLSYFGPCSLATLLSRWKKRADFKIRTPFDSHKHKPGYFLKKPIIEQVKAIN